MADITRPSTDTAPPLGWSYEVALPAAIGGGTGRTWSEQYPTDPTATGAVSCTEAEWFASVHGQPDEDWMATALMIDDFFENATYEDLVAAQDFNGEQAERDAYNDYDDATGGDF